MELEDYTKQAIKLLQELISIQSFSGEEDKTADCIQKFLEKRGFLVSRKGNNIWSEAKEKDPNKKTILLNSHHDTVKPGANWNTDPFEPVLDGDKLYGLGSNDAGASVVSLLASFLYLSKLDLDYNLMIAITAEEENSGANNVASILDELGTIDLAIVGEPTEMHAAIAERGLVVLDCYAHGKTGHAARNEGENAITKAMKDLEWFQTYQFEKVSDFLGPIKMTVTQIDAGKQHNVVPDVCHFVVDVRVNEHYTNQEIAELITEQVRCEVKPRSFRLNSSGIQETHPIVEKAKQMGRETYGSPTLSDQAVMPFASIKMGPGYSGRSHTPNEYILLSEIKEGIQLYIALLKDFKF